MSGKGVGVRRTFNSQHSICYQEPGAPAPAGGRSVCNYVVGNEVGDMTLAQACAAFIADGYGPANPAMICFRPGIYNVAPGPGLAQAIPLGAVLKGAGRNSTFLFGGLECVVAPGVAGGIELIGLSVQSADTDAVRLDGDVTGNGLFRASDCSFISTNSLGLSKEDGAGWSVFTDNCLIRGSVAGIGLTGLGFYEFERGSIEGVSAGVPDPPSIMLSAGALDPAMPVRARYCTLQGRVLPIGATSQESSFEFCKIQANSMGIDPAAGYVFDSSLVLAPAWQVATRFCDLISGRGGLDGAIMSPDPAGVTTTWTNTRSQFRTNSTNVVGRPFDPATAIANRPIYIEDGVETNASVGVVQAPDGYVLAGWERVVEVDLSGGNVGVTLPALPGGIAWKFTFKVLAQAGPANDLNVTIDAGNTIEDPATGLVAAGPLAIVAPAVGTSITFYASGTVWRVLSP